MHSQTRRKASRNAEEGYVLLMLLLTVALIVIALAVALPTIKYEIERDREEEMIHRGVEYARAIQHYYKKFGRYPTKIEDLENTNNIRFLRKRYKDPTNCFQGKCQDFKLLHYGEVKLFGQGIGGGTIPGATPVGSPGDNSSGGLGTPSTPGASSAFGSSSAFGGSSFGQGSAFGGNSGLGQSPGGNSAFGANSNSAFGANQPGASQTPDSDNSTPGTNPQEGANPSAAGSEENSQAANQTNSGEQSSNQVFGGGPILGVVSLNKKTGFREFNHKKKYSEWQFIYDPGTDMGGLLMTPNQPPMQGPGQIGTGTENPNGQNTGSTGIGPGNGLGTSPSGMQNSPNPSSGPGAPAQPGNAPDNQ